MAYKDPEDKKAYNKKYYQENKEEINANEKNRYQENKEKRTAQEKNRYKKKCAENPSVVYVIECKATNKYYIGQTSAWFGNRVKQHRSLFKKLSLIHI